jgi:dTDP-glucose 4,6-dehydratase
MNDYAISKWAGELMCLNAAKMFGNEIVRVRPVNCYGPHEEYTPYRGFVPKFIYLGLHRRPWTLFTGHLRIIDYVEDTCRTVANIMDNFIPGEVYNVGSCEEWEMDVKDISDIIVRETGTDPALIDVRGGEPHTTRVKKIDFSKIIRDLDHRPVVDPEQGIRRTVEWMRDHYRIGRESHATKL